MKHSETFWYIWGYDWILVLTIISVFIHFINHLNMLLKHVHTIDLICIIRSLLIIYYIKPINLPCLVSTWTLFFLRFHFALPFDFLTIFSLEVLEELWEELLLSPETRIRFLVLMAMTLPVRDLRSFLESDNCSSKLLLFGDFLFFFFLELFFKELCNNLTSALMAVHLLLLGTHKVYVDHFRILPLFRFSFGFEGDG